MEKLIQKQTQVMTRIENFIDNTKKSGKEKFNESFFQIRIDLLNKYWDNFQSAHYELISDCTKEDLASPYFKENQYETTELIYCEAYSELKEMVKKLKPDYHDSSTNRQSTSGANNSTSNLPKIQLTRFSGDIKEWPAFHDLFKSLIDSNDDLKGSQKLYYLKTSLSGSAEQLLRNTMITDANYATAWQLLCDRYQNPRLLVTSYLKFLSSLPSMQSESAESLRQLYDGTNEAVKALQSLNRPVKSWDDWLVFSTVQRLDPVTMKDWENSLSSTTILPTFDQLCTFLQHRLNTLEAINVSEAYSKDNNKTMFQKSSSRIPPLKVHVATNKVTGKFSKCPKCTGKHHLLFCPSFRQQAVLQRRDFVAKGRLCFNCLRPDHSFDNCPSHNRCKQCNQQHHTMLHLQQKDSFPYMPSGSSTCATNAVSSMQPDRDNQSASNLKPASSYTAGHITALTTNMKITHWPRTILLATAQVTLVSPEMKTLNIRALIDQGSQATFVSSFAATYLQLPSRKVNIPVQGVGSSSGIVKSIVTVIIQSAAEPNFSLQTAALVLPKLSKISIPPMRKITNFSHLQDLHLADPRFTDNTSIDLIIGADIYNLIIRDGLRHGSPMAQNTSLGWILSGPIDTKPYPELSEVNVHHTYPDSSSDQLDVLLQKFWQLEEVPSTQKTLTEEDQACEDFYKTTTRREKDGRYIVKLPIRHEYTNQIAFGDSLSNAVRSLLIVEKRFLSNNLLKTRYTDFMKEYYNHSHMELISDEQGNHQPSCHFYLPHHGVLRENNVSTKLRVVFNGSKPSKGGLSLNDYLAGGPKLQSDLCVIISRWRLHLITFTADIRMMYRQIRVDRPDCDLQRIVWRQASSAPIQSYRLLTVTYGTSSAPYLAIRTLLQLAEDKKFTYPIGSEVIRNNFYVDDVLFGADTVQLAVKAQRELVDILKAGGFQLHKWASNSDEALQLIGAQGSNVEVNLSKEAVIKTLGLFWNPSSDCFNFQVKIPDLPSILTKRTLLSDVAKLYDPLGFISPTILIAKSMIQRLWLQKLDWDTPLPQNIAREWRTFRQELEYLQNISIPRWIGIHSSTKFYEVHAFSDASEQDFSAVVYFRAVQDYNNVQISLLCAKTKLAPLKPVTIPRLELMGAHLLAKLVKSLESTLALESIPIYCWTDSLTVLAWLKAHPSKWKTFIANRASQILELVPTAKWKYVPSNSNPADCASRGIPAPQLVTHHLWWEGPQWLKCSSTAWPELPTRPVPIETDLEEKSPITSAATTFMPIQRWNLILRYSSLNRLLSVTAWIFRFHHNATARKSLKCRETGHLTPKEIHNALLFWVRCDQQIAFPKEYQNLSRGRTISASSSILRLSPYFETVTATLRVGGRLQNASMFNDSKHQFALSKGSPLSTLIVRNAHQKTLHGGVQLTLCYIRQKFWILGARDLVRSFVRRCMTCFRQRSSAQQQLMGILPPERVQPSRPFLHSGLDYAGPILVRYGPGRGRPAHKAYIALFVCMATKAVHLELVSDLTSDAFIAAYKRFTARRGYCRKIFSDNATTFVGSSKELRQSFFMCQSKLPPQLIHLLTSQGTEWHFIPPSAPNFGGLWEAGVKAVKHHFKRVIGSSSLTFEELYTLLTQIEACLNSRPIYPMSPDADDLEVLTPGHFLIGDSLLTVPESTDEFINPNRLSRWKMVTHMYNHFWKRWSVEYLNNLQERTKWLRQQHNLRPGLLVLIRDDRLPPATWALGRITAVHPGSDGLVRVITIKSRGHLFKRPINKVCVLPLPDNDEFPGSQDTSGRAVDVITPPTTNYNP